MAGEVTALLICLGSMNAASLNNLGVVELHRPWIRPQHLKFPVSLLTLGFFLLLIASKFKQLMLRFVETPIYHVNS